MTHFRPTPLTAALPATVPFTGPEEIERRLGSPFRARLGANESPFGPSPKAIAAMQAAAQDVWMYADPSHHRLKRALCDHLGCAPENIVLGEGIDGLLGYLVRLCVTSGDAVVTSDGAYPTFNYHVAGFGGTLHKVPYRDDAEDLPALIAKARETQAKLIYFANPDNPMGSWMAGDQIVSALQDLPKGTLLVLDEAYAEFAPAKALPDLSIADPRVIRMRTFSKGHGMAGARVGYAFGNADIIQPFDKIRNHFGMNRLSLDGACAALEDVTWLESVVAKVAQGRDHLSEIAQSAGCRALPSATNFVAIDCGRDGAFAKAVLEALARDGVFVRMPFVAPQNRCIRVSVGPEQDLDIFADAFPKALETAHSGT